jgi:hypothetical protein
MSFLVGWIDKRPGSVSRFTSPTGRPLGWLLGRISTLFLGLLEELFDRRGHLAYSAPQPLSQSDRRFDVRSDEQATAMNCPVETPMLVVASQIVASDHAPSRHSLGLARRARCQAAE